MVVVLASLGFSTRPKASPAPEDVPSRLTYSTYVIEDTPECGTFSACQSNCNAAYPAMSGDEAAYSTGQSCDIFCYDPTSCPGSDSTLADGYNSTHCDKSETGTFSDCDSDDVPCGPFNLGVDYRAYGSSPCPDFATIDTCDPTTLLRVMCSSDDCQGTPPFYDDGACLGPNKGCDGPSDDVTCTPDCDSDDLSCQDSLCIQKDASKDNYGLHLFSARGCDNDDCDSDCDLFCTGGNGRRRHKKSVNCDKNDCNDLSIYTPSETNGRRRCGPTDANSKFGFIGADSECETSCDGADCDDSSSSNSCDNTEAVAEDIQADWNADAAALSNPTVAFDPYPKDAQVSVAESDAFRGCDYKTVGVSITDALTGGDVTEQKPHCDWEGFDDGKYKNAWNGCDWGSCDEWE